MSFQRIPSAYVATLVLLSILGSGCVINSSSRTERSGNYVSDTTLSHIDEGDEMDFVLAVLGEPTERVILEDDSELWKWAFTETKTSNGSVILILGSNHTKETRSQVYVRFDEEGYVDRVWRD